MNCKCNWVESILAIVIILFAFMETTYSMWIIVISAVLLLIHAISCKKCKVCDKHGMSKTTVSTKGKKRKR